MKVKDVLHVLVIGPWHEIVRLRRLELFSDFEHGTGALCRSDQLGSPIGRVSVWVAFELKDIVLSMTRVPCSSHEYLCRYQIVGCIVSLSPP